jgi:hypothetical protein
MIAYPFRPLQCCLVADGGGALILVAAERARDFAQSLRLAANRGPGLSPQHWRERRDADGQPNGELHFLVRVPLRRPQDLCRGRCHAQGRRSTDHYIKVVLIGSTRCVGMDRPCAQTECGAIQL